jgi:Glycosyl transferase 4-like domain
MERSIDVVLITGAPCYPMLLASEIKRRFDVPVILDFQDPWVSTRGATQFPLSKAGLSHRLARVLEPRALQGADFVTSVSDIHNVQVMQRYRWLDPARMAAIPIGGDPDDFAAISTRVVGHESDFEPGFIHLSYVGTFLPRSELLVRALFRAFVRLRSDEPAVAQRIRLNFVGTSNQPNGEGSFRVRPIAEAEGVEMGVHEIPERLPYLRALKSLIHSNGLLLIGSDELHYTASKIYPALMSGRPYLSLFHQASSAHAILSSAGGGRTLAFGTPQELDALERPLAEGLRTLALHPDSLGIPNRAAYAPYEARNIAGRFAYIFDRVAAGDAVMFPRIREFCVNSRPT